MGEQPVSERIKILLDKYSYGNKAAMGRSLNISGQAIADLVEGKKGGPSFPVLQKMLTLYSDVRAEWLIFGEEPMLKTKVKIASNVTPTEYSLDNKVHVTSAVGNEGHAVQSSVTLSDEQLSQIYRAVYSSLVDSEEIKRGAALVNAKIQAEVDLMTNIYWIGEPNPSRPYNGLLTERLGISEEEAKQLVLSGKLLAGVAGSPKRITNYRIGEPAIRKFLEGISGDKHQVEYK